MPSNSPKTRTRETGKRPCSAAKTHAKHENGPVLRCYRQSELPGRSSRKAKAIRRTPRSSRRSAKAHPGRMWRSFNSTLERLRELCPPGQPVDIKFTALKRCLGHCCRRGSRFQICISRVLDEEAAIETLIHEWAHALAWNYSIDRLARAKGISATDFDRESHGPAWGVAYSVVYQTATSR